MKSLFSLILGLLPLLLVGQSQPPEEDPTAAQYLLRGKAFLEEQDLAMALLAFEAARDRPFHQATTASIYLVGLTHYYLENWGEAQRHFAWLQQEFPRSRYEPEARYHLALMGLKSADQARQYQAIEALFSLTELSQLAYDADQALRAYLFYEANREDLRHWARRVRPEHQHLILEAWCFLRINEGEFLEATADYRAYQAAGGRPIPSLQRLLEGDQMVQFVEPDLSKICLFLPLHLDPLALDTIDWRDSLPSIPKKSRLALEFYEGFQLALETYLPLAGKKIFAEVIDSQRDSARIVDQMSYLDSLRPDLVVGDIFNQPSRVLGEWSETRGVPQIVPMSPSSSLVENRQYGFLAHPSASGHGLYAARFAREKLALKRVVVWSDGRKATEALAEAFVAGFDTLGGEVLKLTVDSVYSDSTRDLIQELVRSLRFQEVDGAYLPIQGNQEMAGLILGQMRLQDLAVQVMGGPHWWQRYETINREMKESYGLMFTTSYMIDKADPVYQTFEQAYLRQYQFPPSLYSVHGYDMGMYVAQMLDGFSYDNGQSLAAFLRNAPPYEGMHLTIDFQGTQQNQFVNIGTFGRDRIRKVNGPVRLEVDRLLPVSEEPTTTPANR
jgi:ABC-type branched-subunit amino acid transport system substrate-binding protein